MPQVIAPSMVKGFANTAVVVLNYDKLMQRCCGHSVYCTSYARAECQGFIKWDYSCVSQGIETQRKAMATAK